MADLIKREIKEIAPETVEIVSVVVQNIMAPLMESIGKMLQHNTEAMEQIAAAQQMTSERIAALERKVRLQTPLSKTQEKYINDAIRNRARELLAAKGYASDRKAVTRLSGCIRKDVLTRYGVGSLREAPAYDYETALKQISVWNNFLSVRDTVTEAKERSEAGNHENNQN